MTLSAEDRARRIKIILFDVDGVLTDGGIWLFPSVLVLRTADLR
jgi:3-deoxy-D-manno-octulosonate 8-phosphate phosphatase (KDO 8-P phosphatase)